MIQFIILFPYAFPMSFSVTSFTSTGSLQSSCGGAPHDDAFDIDIVRQGDMNADCKSALSGLGLRQDLAMGDAMGVLCFHFLGVHVRHASLMCAVNPCDGGIVECRLGRTAGCSSAFNAVEEVRRVAAFRCRLCEPAHKMIGGLLVSPVAVDDWKRGHRCTSGEDSDASP